MRPRATTLVLFLFLGVSCRSEAPSGGPDAAAPPPSTALDVAELGLSLELPSSWTLRGPAAKSPSSADGSRSVRTWIEVRRAKDDRGIPLLVPARVVITSEPAPEEAPELVFARILAELESIGDRPGVTLERSGFSSRPLGGFDTARLRVRYRVGGAAGTRVRHESLVVLHPATDDRAAEVVTVTGTFAARDAAAVEAEIHRALERVELTVPAEGTHD